MGIYGIRVDEFLDGVTKRSIYINKETERVGFEEFLRSFEGDISAHIVAEAWNKLAEKYEWDDKLKVKKNKSMDRHYDGH